MIGFSNQKVEDSEERRIHYTNQVIENELFPHMGISTPLEKGILLGTMINKLFRVCLGKRKLEDRDNISIKRIEGPGVLLGELFRMCLKRYCDNLKKYLEKRQDIITAMARTNNITSSLKHVFSTGNWAVQKNSYVRTGVSQIMSRLTYPATISHLRRVIIPIGKRRKFDRKATWGEAMLGAAYVFAVLFLAFGVVPHQWIDHADKELGWRKDKLVYGPFNILKSDTIGGSFPIVISYEAIRDIVVVVIHVF